MRLTSYLVKNRFGVFYFRIVFPPAVCAILNRKETRRSLKTREKGTAISMSLEFQQINKELFKIIIRDRMKWIEAQKLFDEVAEKLFQKYVQRVGEVGFDFDDPDSLSNILPAGSTFLAPGNPEWQQTLHWDIDSGKMQNKSDFEASYYQQPEVVQFVDKIIKQYKLPLKSDEKEYKKFCHQTLEMLYRLDKRKSHYKAHLLHGEQPLSPVVASANDTASDLPKITIRQLTEKFIDFKINIEKNSWASRTEKGYRENLGRINDIFNYVAKKDTPISSMTKEHARQVRKVLSLIPTNMKKKYPNLTFRQTITKVKKGEIAQLDSERLSPNTFNTYAGLITTLFNFAVDEGYLEVNHFNKLRVPKKVRKTRSAFTDDELKKFFNDDLFIKKDCPLKWSWRFWVPVIMLYTGARVEEVCQLYLEDIREEKGVLCFHLVEKIDEKTGQKLTSLKNSQSARIIPVHPKLKKIGLLDYVQFLKEKGESQLFPTLTNRTKSGSYKQRNTAVSKWFNENSPKQKKTSHIKKCGIKDTSKVLYCFRHTVETVLINHHDNIENDKIDTLMGHEVKSMGRKHYGQYSPEILLEIVEKIEYPAADLPWDVDGNYSIIKSQWES